MKEIVGKEIDVIESEGKLIGEQSPTKDSKGSWGQLYFNKGKFYHFCIGDTQNCEVVFVEEIEEEQVLKMVDDPDSTRSIIETLKIS